MCIGSRNVRDVVFVVQGWLLHQLQGRGWRCDADAEDESGACHALSPSSVAERVTRSAICAPQCDICSLCSSAFTCSILRISDSFGNLCLDCFQCVPGKVVLSSGGAGHGSESAKTKWFLEPAQGTVLIRLITADSVILETGACMRLY
jgi:hypothetical protein